MLGINFTCCFETVTHLFLSEILRFQILCGRGNFILARRLKIHSVVSFQENLLNYQVPGDMNLKPYFHSS